MKRRMVSISLGEFEEDLDEIIERIKDNLVFQISERLSRKYYNRIEKKITDKMIINSVLEKVSSDVKWTTKGEQCLMTGIK